MIPETYTKYAKMVTADRPPRNGFVAAMRKVYNPIGFSKGYNAVLWFIFDGALLGFILARMMYFNYWGTFCNPNAPGKLLNHYKQRSAHVE